MMTPNRVLMIVQNAPYPQDPRVRNEVQTLAAAGCEVSVIAPRGRGAPWREVKDHVCVYRFPAPLSGNGIFAYFLEYSYSLVAIFLVMVWVYFRRGFEVIHVANPPDLLCLAAMPFKLLGKRFVYDHHDLCPELYVQRFGAKTAVMLRLLYYFERLSCRLADRIIATNTSHQRMEVSRAGVPKERIAIVRNGPRLSRVRSVTPDPELRTKAPTIIMYAGITGFQDGLDYLCRAIHRLKFDLQRQDFCCAIVGDGDALDSIKQLVRELGIEDRVWFAGWISDPDRYSKYVATADICVSPEPSNPYNDCSTLIKIMEYMAAGKPIVAFDVPETRFSAGKAALYAADNDELKFAHALEQLMDNPSLRSTMGQIGKERIEKELAWEYSEPYLLRTYADLFGNTAMFAAPSR